ncbi:MAG: hypothetical protein V3U53_09655, partial [bacterium]
PPPPAGEGRGERETLAFRREEVALNERDAFAGVHPARHSVGGDEPKVKKKILPENIHGLRNFLDEEKIVPARNGPEKLDREIHLAARFDPESVSASPESGRCAQGNRRSG